MKYKLYTYDMYTLERPNTFCTPYYSSLYENNIEVRHTEFINIDKKEQSDEFMWPNSFTHHLFL